jgi:zinc transporter ZupT
MSKERLRQISCIILQLLNILVQKIVGHKHDPNGKSKRTVPQNVDAEGGSEQSPPPERCETTKSSGTFSETLKVGLDDDWGYMCIPGTSDELEFLQYVATNMANEMAERQENSKKAGSDHEISQEMQECPIQEGFHSDTESASLSNKYNDRKLLQMSLLMAIAIALHNFPEGLATFVTVLDNPSVGTVLAIAIAIHNVPEGLCVTLPVYYATGSRRKAFLWGALSGTTEIVAAFFGWAVLSNSYSKSLFAALFGLVAGMMVTISFRELLPTAHRHDPHDKFVTLSFIVGMAVIGLSLVMFRL